VRRISIVILAVLAAGGLGACTSTPPVAAPPTGPATSPGTPPAAPTTTPPAPPQLGPTGYGSLQLGLAKSAAANLAIQASADPSGQCGGSGDGYLPGSPLPDGQSLDGRLFFSGSTNKLVAIYAYMGVLTPQGITVGSTYAQLHAAYPAWHGLFEPTSGRGGVAVPGNPNAHYRIVVSNQKVVQLSLDANDQDCYE
jgi:hypothetical protein